MSSLVDYKDQEAQVQSTHDALVAQGCCAHHGRTTCGAPVVWMLLAPNERADERIRESTAVALQLDDAMIVAGVCQRHLWRPMIDATPHRRAWYEHQRRELEQARIIVVPIEDVVG